MFEYSSDRLNLHEGRKNLSNYEIQLYTLTSWDEVLEIGREKKYFADEACQQILDFLKEPENWGRKMGFE